MGNKANPCGKYGSNVPKPPSDPCEGVTCPPGRKCVDGFCVHDPDYVVKEETLFARQLNGQLDVSWAVSWAQPMIKEAMEYLETYFEKPDGYQAATCSTFSAPDELTQYPNAIASCLIEDAESDNNSVIITSKYKLTVYTKWRNSFTDREWVAIFIHELLHGLGFNQYGWDAKYSGFIGEPPMTNADRALRSPRFEEAVLGYQRQIPSGTAVPLSNLGHILGPGESYDGNPGVQSLMNATTSTNLLIEMDSILTGYFSKFGYVVKKIAPKNTQVYTLPKGFVCGNNL